MSSEVTDTITVTYFVHPAIGHKVENWVPYCTMLTIRDNIVYCAYHFKTQDDAERCITSNNDEVKCYKMNFPTSSHNVKYVLFDGTQHVLMMKGEPDVDE